MKMEDEITDAEAARAIERQVRSVQERVERGGVMEYLKPLGPGGRKDVNKLFLWSTIKSVDSHNRRHEEEKCWKLRELEKKLDDRKRSRRRSRSRSRSSSRSPNRTRRRERSRSRSCSSSSRNRLRNGSDGTQRLRRSRSRSPKHRGDSSRRRDQRSRSRERSSQESVRLEKSTENFGSDNEREFWAAKKAEKTKKMWETMYSSTASILVDNAPEFSSDEDDSDDEDERVDTSSERKKEKKHMKEKKEKSKKEKEKKRKKKRKKHDRQ